MKEILLEEIKRCIAFWENKEDIYAVSLFVYDEDDDPCQPTVTLGYNTLSNYMSYGEDLEDEEEALEIKWNYAFWLQNCELEFGTGESRKIVQEWLEENGFPCDSLEEEDYEEEDLYEVTEAFIDVLVEVVQELHSSGFIQEQFGKEIPVIIHELEYYDEIARQNQRANPAETIEEFLEFCG